MKKLIYCIFVFLTFIPTAVFALQKLPSPLGTDDIPLIVQRVVQAFLGIVGSIALIVFIYGGFLWLTAMGEDKRVKQGWDTMTWAAMGLAVIFSSYAVLQLLLHSLEGTIVPKRIASNGSAPAPAPAPTPSASTPAPTPAAPASPLLSGEEACTLAGGRCGIVRDGAVVYIIDFSVAICTETIPVSCPGKQVCCKVAGGAKTGTDGDESEGGEEKGLMATDSRGTPCDSPKAIKDECDFSLQLGEDPPPATKTEPPKPIAPIKKGAVPKLRFDESRAWGVGPKTADIEKYGKVFAGVLFDAEGNCPSFGSYVVDLHECIHVINSGTHEDVKHVSSKDGVAVFFSPDPINQRLYFEDGSFVTLKKPTASSFVTKADVKKYLPTAFRKGMVYDTYIEEDIKKEIKEPGNNDGNFDNSLHLLDEFSAYNMEYKGAVDLAQKGYYDKNGKTKSKEKIKFERAYRAAQLVPTVLALGVALEKKDISYLTTKEPRFLPALRTLIEDGVRSYRLRSTKFPSTAFQKKEMQVAREVYDTLRNSNDSKVKALRQFAREWYGPKWTEKWLGF